VDVELPDPIAGPGEVSIEIEAAGVCRSDLHYRSGFPALTGLPRTLGHEIAGTVTAVGTDVELPIGSRVCVHYLVTCGRCRYCKAGTEQFCASGRMLGKELDGGFADAIAVPAANAVPIPDGVTTSAAAVMMCSTATAFHALRISGVGPGATVAIFGAGGLGQSGVQLAHHLGAAVVAVDPNPAKRELAAAYGATPVDPGVDPVAAVRSVAPEGVDVALDLVGSSQVMRAAIDVLAPMGTAVAVGLTSETIAVGPYVDLVSGERTITGGSDHLLTELPELLSMAARGALEIDPLVTRTVSLTAADINDTLDRMQRWGNDVRTVVERGA
jgi:D-arabinose 1-dehydrogenase-like Zn-dependent alcohol dehydrogenase